VNKSQLTRVQLFNAQVFTSVMLMRIAIYAVGFSSDSPSVCHAPILCQNGWLMKTSSKFFHGWQLHHYNFLSCR